MVKYITLEIKGLGIINDAKINLGSLILGKESTGKICVVAGNNSSGKTMLSRVIYSAITSISAEGEEIFKNNFKNHIHHLLIPLYGLNQKHTTANIYSQDNVNTPSNIIFNYPSNDLKQEEFIKKLSMIINYLENFKLGESDQKEFLDKIKKLERILDEYEFLTSKIRQSMEIIVNGIEAYNHFGRRYYESFCILLDDEFSAESNSLFDDKSKVKFNISNDNYIIKVKNHGEVNIPQSPIIKEGDVFYIETPYILDFYKSFEENNPPLYHQKSLVKKLKSEKSKLWVFGKNGENDNIVQKENENIAQKIIFNERKESIYFNDDINDFKYKLNNKKDIDIKNTAVGIKTISALLLLFEKKIEDNSLIIMDEPEIHLHPDWQIKLAKTIILLAKEYKINFHVNSHSPQFIEAIETYSLYYESENDVTYYLAEQSEEKNKFDFNKVNRSDLNKIYNHLGQPYRDLAKIKGKWLAKQSKKRRDSYKLPN